MTAADKPGANSWRQAAIKYHKQRGDRVLIVETEPKRLARLRALLANDVSLARAWAELGKPVARAADSTVEALMLALRRGLDAIKHSDNQRRLSEPNDEQMREIAARVQNFMPHIAPAWKSADVAVLISGWSKLRC